jgi:hypothetical protein
MVNKMFIGHSALVSYINFKEEYISYVHVLIFIYYRVYIHCCTGQRL